MDKTQKLLYQREIEKYLEGKRVYETFQELMKSLVISKPEDPLDFIIDKLSQPQRTIFPVFV
jgi:adenylate kinase